MGIFDPSEPDKDEVLRVFHERVTENEKQARVSNLFTAKSNAKVLQDRLDAIKPNIVVDDKEGFTKELADQRKELQSQLDDLLGAVKTYENTGDINPLREELKRPVHSYRASTGSGGFITLANCSSSIIVSC